MHQDRREGVTQPLFHLRSDALRRLLGKTGHFAPSRTLTGMFVFPHGGFCEASRFSHVDSAYYLTDNFRRFAHVLKVEGFAPVHVHTGR